MQRFFTNAILFATKLPLVGGYIKRAVQARYDSAAFVWGERSFLFQTLQDVWLEIDSMTRKELQRIHDSLIQNSPLVQKIRNLKIQFSVGAAGLKVIPESSDEGFNDARSVSWENWWNKPELGSDISGDQLTRLWAGLLFDKGAIFCNLTYETVEGRKIPRTQTIDCHRVENPPSLREDEKTGFPIVDGVVINPETGAKVAYYVRCSNYSTISQAATTQDQLFDRIEAYQPGIGGMIHKFKMRRPGQIREIPEGFSVYNLVRDNMDLHKLEMHCAKLAAEIGVVETNPSGELDTMANRRTRYQIQTQNSAGVASTKTSWNDYNVSFGGKKYALKTGDKLENFMVHRPTVAQQDYWDLHITMICIGYNVPKMLVMPYSLQGTVTRADLDICTAAFREDFELIRELCECVYEFHGRWDLKFNTGFKPVKSQKKEIIARSERSLWVQDAIVPDDSNVCLIRPPRSPNVDIGYTAKALEIELRLGIKVPQDIFADSGKDWRTQTRQMAEYLTYVKELEKEFDLQPGQITSLTTPQPIDDPTSKPDSPEGDTKESTPEAHYAKT